jgi:anhydro-N-acetylmuramic acid kinase
MSGTSLDAVDLVLADLSVLKDDKNKHLFRLSLNTKTLLHYEASFPDLLKEKLLAVQNTSLSSLADLLHLENRLTDFYALAVHQALESWHIEKSSITAICNHGQTIFHQANPLNESEQLSLQLGNTSRLAELLKLPVIGDFRQGDLAQGGQGAPLLPFFDALYFAEESTHIALHNLGGISNTTILPARRSGMNPFAFDTGLANLWIDLAMRTYFQLAYDAHGRVAQSGQVIPAFLEAILAHPFHAKPIPKSTGRDDYKDKHLFYLVDTYAKESPYEDVVCTLTHATAYTIVQAYRDFVLPQVGSLEKIIFSGGGVENTTLMELIRLNWEALGLGTPPTFHRCEDCSIPTKAKEALGFAYLGWAKWHGLPNTIPSCTGARQAVASGIIYEPS